MERILKITKKSGNRERDVGCCLYETAEYRIPMKINYRFSYNNRVTPSMLVSVHISDGCLAARKGIAGMFLNIEVYGSRNRIMNEFSLYFLSFPLNYMEDSL